MWILIVAMVVVGILLLLSSGGTSTVTASGTGTATGTASGTGTGLSAGTKAIVNNLKIISALYGENLGCVIGGEKCDKTTYLKSLILPANPNKLYTNFNYGDGNGVDPYPGVKKNLVINYSCGDDSTVKTYKIKEEAGLGGLIDITCP